eukprot:SAG31_NODE_6467_length_2006_cov_1.609334_3_plen_213_part_00
MLYKTDQYIPPPGTVPFCACASTKKQNKNRRNGTKDTDIWDANPLAADYNDDSEIRSSLRSSKKDLRASLRASLRSSNRIAPKELRSSLIAINDDGTDVTGRHTTMAQMPTGFEEPAAWPRTSADITTAWLDTVIPGAAAAGGIKSFEVNPVGQGAIADGFKVSMVCNNGMPPPQLAGGAVVLKLSKDDPDIAFNNRRCATANSAALFQLST